MPTHVVNPKSEHFNSFGIRMTALESENDDIIESKLHAFQQTSLEASFKGSGLSDPCHFFSTADA